MLELHIKLIYNEIALAINIHKNIKNYKDGKIMGRFIELKNEELFEYIKNYIADKIEKNSDEVRYSYFELKVKMNMDESDIDKFLKYSRNILEDLDYKVYFTGAKFEYKNAKRTVEDNELMIAVKDGE